MTERQAEYMTETPTPYETTYRANYRRYLASYAWKRKRERILRRDGYQCQNCGGIPATEVHHTRYPKVWGEEKDADLISLCRYCHRAAHDLSPFERVDELPY